MSKNGPLYRSTPKKPKEKDYHAYVLLGGVGFVFVVFLVGVGYQRLHAPQKEAAVESARPHRPENIGPSSDYKQTFVHDAKLLAELDEEWNQAVTLAGATPKIALSNRVADLQAMRRRFAMAELQNDCFKNIKDSYLRRMDNTIEGFVSFMQGLESSANSYFNLASTDMEAIRNKLGACTNKP